MILHVIDWTCVYKDADLLAVLNLTEDDLDEGVLVGDIWVDCDLARLDGQEYHWRHVHRDEDHWIVCRFDPLECNAVVQMISDWIVSRDQHFERVQGPRWSDFENAQNALAYRGGEGYTYGIYIWKGEADER